MKTFIRVLVLVIVLLFIPILSYKIASLFKTRQTYVKKTISCGGDWSYTTKCPPGTYCKSLNKGALAGGICTPIGK